jgi:hypothetical protein
VAKAEGLAQPAGDKAAFVALLQQALPCGHPAAPTLANEDAPPRRWLLNTADDLF